MKRVLIASLLLTLTTCSLYAAASAPTTRRVLVGPRLIGEYRGEIVDDGELCPITTRFFKDKNGRLVGQYRVTNGDESYGGNLEDFSEADEDGACTFTWHDKHGQGVAKFTLKPGDGEFSGEWGTDVPEKELTWSGRRQVAK